MNVSVSHPTNRPNFTQVTVGSLTIWFSYKTPIAFQEGWGSIVVRENDWNQTTGKHLNWVNADKSTRIDGREFEAELAKVLPSVDVLP